MKKLFSIPIYSCKREKFEKDHDRLVYNRSKDFREAAEYSGKYTEEEAIEKYKKYVIPKIWEYNQIIGFIKVFIHEHSIWFDLYLPSDKKINRFAKTKHFVSLNIPNGCHFSLMGNNDEIRSEMSVFLNMAIDSVPKKYYVDKTEFELLNKIIDYSKLPKE